ncbi:MAG TPA: metallophosphoesterase [Caproicibacter sp.]|nr:metallophosphoesterase [Caproicibacter sp.]
MKTRKSKSRFMGKVVKAVSCVFPENHILQVSQYRVESEKIPQAFNGYRIVQLSDLHGCSFGRNNHKLIEKIEAAGPDAVFLTGDMADRQTKHYEGVFGLSKALCSRYPVYYVMGNHEQELLGPRRRAFLDGMRRQGVRILDNSSASLEQGGKRIALYGIRIPMKYYRASGRGKHYPQLSPEKVSSLLGICGQTNFSILLAHNPFYFDAYAGWGADLTLCGHVHGGMIRLPHYGGLLSPERKFFPKYTSGIYESESSAGRKMLVSRGLGSGARICNRPEIVVLTLFHAP